jgi:hypothetical protein
VDVDKVNNEWQLLGENDLLKQYANTDLTLFWKKVAETKNELGELMFGNLMEIVKCVLSLPHSSAAAQRMFSQLPLNKTKLRNRLNITTMSNIMAVKQNIRDGIIHCQRSHLNFKQCLFWQHNTLINT